MPIRPYKAAPVSQIGSDKLFFSKELKRIEGHATQVADALTAIEGDITSIEGDITSIEGDITALQALPACFYVHKNGTPQTGIADVTFTLVTWPFEVYDVGGHFASNGWTPPAGKVAMNACSYVEGTQAAGGLVLLDIYKNGNSFKRHHAAGSYGSGGFINIVAEDIANGTDVYTVITYIDVTAGTGTLNGAATHHWFQGHWISA